jgi:4-amino-4-deoxy-L-arabinose transferase-like glycosyltransferase
LEKFRMDSVNPSLAATPESGDAGSWRRDLLWLALAFALLYGFRLGSYPISGGDDGRNAEIPREMLATGDWVTPRLNGVNYFEKPPLVYWAGALAQKFLGPSEWSLRSVPALAALAGVLLTYAAARRLHGRPAGLLSAIVLGTSLLYFAIGHIMILDMPVSVLMAATLFCFLLGVEATGPRRCWLFHGLYVAAALATLTKGLIGVLIPGAVMFLWLLVFNQWKRLRPLYLPTGLLLFLAIAVPWHVLAAQRNETWVHRYFVYEHFERFFTPAAARPGAWHYYIGVVIAGMIPWIGFLWPALRDGLRGGWAARERNARAWFFVTWALFIFLFFTKSQSKLIPYILPIWPALAVLIGAWLAEKLRSDEAAPLRGGARVFAFICGLLAVALVIVVSRPTLVRMDPAQAAALKLPAIGMALALLVGGVGVLWLAKMRGARATVTAMAATMAVFFAALQFAAPDINKPSTKELALYVKAHARPGDRVLHYHEFFHDFTYYAGRLVDVVAFKGELELEEDATARASGRFMDEPAFRRLWNEPGRIFAVARKKDLKPLFDDPSFHYHLLAESRDHTLFSNQP